MSNVRCELYKAVDSLPTLREKFNYLASLSEEINSKMEAIKHLHRFPFVEIVNEEEQK